MGVHLSRLNGGRHCDFGFREINMTKYDFSTKRAEVGFPILVFILFVCLSLSEEAFGKLVRIMQRNPKPLLYSISTSGPQLSFFMS
jgi:hypothetical protein